MRRKINRYKTQKSVITRTSLIKSIRKALPTLHSNITEKPKTAKRPTKLAKLYSNLNSKRKCKVTVADASRRKAFFKAKSKGGGSRPAHNKTHKRTC